MVEQHRFNVMSDRRIRMAECEIGRQATWLSVVSAKAVIFGTAAGMHHRLVGERPMTAPATGLARGGESASARLSPLSAPATGQGPAPTLARSVRL
jgi:hypothetical protein